MRAIILAGGKGTRLRPYTTLFPKPLVPLGGEISVIEIIIKQLVKYKFSRVTIAVNHLSNLIKSYLGDGSQFNIKIDYSQEKKELGTLGPLTLINDLPKNFLVMNGDVITDLNLKKFLISHKKNNNKITIATCKRKSMVNYGTLETENEIVKKFSEKPNFSFTVSMGIFCLEKSVIDKMRKNSFLNFDKFIIKNIKNGVSAIKHDGLWLDIGRVEDYELANKNFVKLKKKLWKV